MKLSDKLKAITSNTVAQKETEKETRHREHTRWVEEVIPFLIPRAIEVLTHSAQRGNNEHLITDDIFNDIVGIDCFRFDFELVDAIVENLTAEGFTCTVNRHHGFNRGKMDIRVNWA